MSASTQPGPNGNGPKTIPTISRHEEEKRLPDIDAYRNAEIDRFIEEMLSAANAPELLVGVHQVAGKALQTAYRHHIDNTDSITDAPTIRVLRRILTDYEPMLEWA